MSNFKSIENTRIIVLLILTVYLTACATTKSADDAQLHEKQVQYNLFQAKQQFRTGSYKSAMLHGVKVLSLEPGNPIALKIVAAIHELQKEYIKAEQTYRTLLAFQPANSFAHEGIGIILLRKGNVEKSKSHLTAARQDSPVSWRAENALGVIYDLEGNYKKAAEYYRSAMSMSLQPKILNNYGFNQYLQGDLVSAELLFKQIIHTDPKNKIAWSNLALVFFKMNKHENAINALEHIMPKHQALNNIGYLAKLANRPEQARMLLQEATREAPGYYKKAYANLADMPQ